MGKKTNDQLAKELQEKIDALSTNYVELIMKCDEEKDKDGDEDKKFFENLLQQKNDTKRLLESYKRDLKFILSMKSKTVDKKAEKELKKQQDDIINWVKKMPSSIGDIVKTIPKH